MKAARGKDDECPMAKYSTKVSKQDNNDNNNNQTKRSLGTFGNGWSEQGRIRYCELMQEVNESRAFYKGSFDNRMKRFATTRLMKEENLCQKKEQLCLTWH